MPHLFCFGLGFSGQTLAADLLRMGWTVSGTRRNEEGCAAVQAMGVTPWLFDGSAPLPSQAFDGVTHVLGSIPPTDEGDPALALHGEDISARGNAGQIEWTGYLSTTGVYGDHDGGWVDESTPIAPDVSRSRRRAIAEDQWQALTPSAHLFRLAGIYGPGRNAMASLRAGRARCVIKPNQWFCRIHVADIAQVVAASLAAPQAGRVYNVCDDLPAPPEDPIRFAADLLGIPHPPAVPFEEADLSPMARSFYADSRRVRNDRIKQELGVSLRYPTYREGLTALYEAEEKGLP